jgi:hypothetical protein
MRMDLADNVHVISSLHERALPRKYGSAEPATNLSHQQVERLIAQAGSLR